MNTANRDLDERTRMVFERVFYHIARTILPDDLMENMIFEAIDTINSVNCTDCLLVALDNDIEDMINELDLPED